MVKKSQEVKEEVKEIVEEVKPEILTPADPDTNTPETETLKPNTPETVPTVSDYKASGRAMIKFIGNREVTKKLLEAIINSEIPNIKFTGEV